MAPHEQMHPGTPAPGDTSAAVPTVPRPLPRWAEDPRPALAVGIVVFTALGVIALIGGAAPVMAATGFAGVVVGAAGWGVYAWQRAAVRRGARWVQDGLGEG